MQNVIQGAAAAPLSQARIEQTYSKVAWRIIPLLFLCYVMAYLDRVNVGFAKLQMLNDLQFSEAVYGFGAGIFFIGYFFFEVPSNLILHRVGARRWIARIMITWGLLSACTMFVTTPATFYVLRFFLGVAEAGFFPGIILYLTYWFPAERRGSMTALFMTAIPLSGVIGGPLSGWIMEGMAGKAGLAGWQWLFVLEGLPTVLVGIAVLYYLLDRIDDAKWLDADEKRMLKEKIALDEQSKGHGSLREAFGNPRVWVLCLIYFCLIMGLYGISFWLPSIIAGLGVKGTLHVGLIYAIPYALATVGMVVVGRSADAKKERRWHIAIPCLLGALGLILSVTFKLNAVLAIAALSLGTIGMMAAIPLFWSCPTAFLGGAAAAGGIALINSMGNLAGFASPYMVGYVKQVTQSTDYGMYVLAGCLVLAAVLVITALPARLVNK